DSVRLHPIFTQVTDWTGDAAPDGIEALVEINDEFGDATKGGGKMIFELFEFRPRNPDPRGRRVTTPWVGALGTLAEQKAHWNSTTQTYNFELAYPQIDSRQTYVLSVVFHSDTGERFFDQTVLTPQE